MAIAIADNSVSTVIALYPGAISVHWSRKYIIRFRRLQIRGQLSETLSTADQPYPSGCSHGLRGKIIINPNDNTPTSV